MPCLTESPPPARIPVLTSPTRAGVVRDTSGAVMPGVTVQAASPALIEKVRSVVTDSLGRYRIADLRPGLYIVHPQRANAVQRHEQPMEECDPDHGWAIRQSPRPTHLLETPRTGEACEQASLSHGLRSPISDVRSAFEGGCI